MWTNCIKMSIIAILQSWEFTILLFALLLKIALLKEWQWAIPLIALLKKVTMSESLLLLLTLIHAANGPKGLSCFEKQTFYICFTTFCLPIQKVRTKTWFLKEELRVVKQCSSLLKYMLFHAAPDRNWFLHLMSHRCAKVVYCGGVHYCTDRNTVFRCDSDKNSFVIIRIW